MKLRTSHIIVFLIFFMSVAASAQVNRRIGSGQYKRAKQDKNVGDPIEQSSAYLKKELKLDDFQAAAVKEIMEDERANLTLLQASTDMTKDEVRDRAKEISDRIYKKVLPLLSKEQAALYTKMMEDKKF